MQRKFLSKMDRAFVEELRANTRDKGAYMKLSVLILLDMDKSYAEIAEILGLGQGTVSNCRQKFEQDGLEKYLDRHYVPYLGRLTDEQLAQLEDVVSQGLYTSTAAVQTYIEQTFAVTYSTSAVRAILRKLDFVYKKTMSVPGKADVMEQEAFLAQLEPFLEEIDPQNEVVYFLDAVHPHYNTRPNYAWIKRGEQKPVATTACRRHLNLHGALNAHQPQEVIIQEAERVNSLSTIALLERLLEVNQDKTAIYLVADNASYYHGEAVRAWLAQHSHVTLIHLPPYSPNLNLIERLWKFMRKRVIDLQFYPSFKLFRAAVLDFFSNIRQYKTELRSLMQHNFQRLPVLEQI